MDKFIKKGDTIIIGVSGGPDSLYLLIQCLNLKKIYPFKIIIAHVNHKRRGSASDKDEYFVQSLSKKHGLIFELKKTQKIGKGNVEEEMRNERYDFFEKLRKKYKARWILTAHHRDDNIETVLFHIARGSFLGGLKGMEMYSEKRHLLRPLLQTSKSEILTYLHDNHFKYRVDKTNKDTKFSRNALRHKIIPLFQTINPNFQQTFAKNLQDLGASARFIDQYSEKWLKKNQKKQGISLKKLLEEDPIIQKNIVAYIYKSLYGSSNKFNQKHLEQILKLLHQQKSNRKKEFGDNYFIGIKKEKNEQTVYIARK